VKILCGGCRRQIEVDDALAGGEVQCPSCNRMIHVPSLDAVAAEEPPRPGADGGAGDLADEFVAKARLALRKKLLVVCESCGERLAVEQRLAGNVARCPSCGEQIVIPSVAEDDLPVSSEDLMAEPDQPPSLDITERATEGPGTAPAAARPAAPAPPETADARKPSAPELDFPLPLPPRPRRRPSPRRRVMPIVLLVATVGIATGLLGVMAGRMWTPTPAPDGTVAPAPHPTTPEDPGHLIAQTPDPEPEPATDPTPVAPPIEPPPPPPAPKAFVKVVRARISGLGPAGMVPAPLQQAYAVVTVHLQAGAEGLTIDPARGRVTLSAGGQDYPAIGTPAGGPVPLAAKVGSITVPAKASSDQSFVFLVPTGARSGTIRVAGLPDAEAPLIERTDPPPPEALAGTYKEASRRLKLAFNDPFLERIRAAGAGKLTVTADGKAFDVSLPAAGLTGKANFDRDGIYRLLLADGRDERQCHLRLVDGGAKLVLYLADKPYHQVIYTRQ